MADAIRVENLAKIYPGDIRAVDGVSFSVREGEFFGFLGPNGAGKTTTIKVLATLLKPTSGRAEVAGFDVVGKQNEVHTAIGFAMQIVGLDDLATGREHLWLFGRLHHLPKSVIKEQSEALLKMVELEKVADRFVGTYSGGMRRRLDLAVALMHKPKVLFLDEPTTGLDPHARNLIWQHLRRLNQDGVTVFLTTHSMEEADALCERIAIIDQGKIVAIGTPAELKQKVGKPDTTLEDVFLTLTGHALREEALSDTVDPYLSMRAGRR